MISEYVRCYDCGRRVRDDQAHYGVVDETGGGGGVLYVPGAGLGGWIGGGGRAERRGWRCDSCLENFQKEQRSFLAQNIFGCGVAALLVLGILLYGFLVTQP